MAQADSNTRPLYSESYALEEMIALKNDCPLNIEIVHANEWRVLLLL